MCSPAACNSGKRLVDRGKGATGRWRGRHIRDWRRSDKNILRSRSSCPDARRGRHRSGAGSSSVGVEVAAIECAEQVVAARDQMGDVVDQPSLLEGHQDGVGERSAFDGDASPARSIDAGDLALACLGASQQPSSANRCKAGSASARRSARAAGDRLGGPLEAGQFCGFGAGHHQRVLGEGSCRRPDEQRPSDSSALASIVWLVSSSSLLSNHWIFSGRPSRSATAWASAMSSPLSVWLLLMRGKRRQVLGRDQNAQSAASAPRAAASVASCSVGQSAVATLHAVLDPRDPPARYDSYLQISTISVASLKQIAPVAAFCRSCLAFTVAPCSCAASS